MPQTGTRVVLESRRLTPVQRRELEHACRNRLNWSDSGRWIGTGAAPNCFMRDALSNRLAHTLHFRSDPAATKWNLEWERVIRYGGHVATVGITVAVSLATSGSAGIAVGALAAIMKDELQARVPYPRMARGWSYQLVLEHDFIQMVAPPLGATRAQAGDHHDLARSHRWRRGPIHASGPPFARRAARRYCPSDRQRSVPIHTLGLSLAWRTPFDA